MDFYAVGGIPDQRGDQLLHRRRQPQSNPWIGSGGGAIFRQTEGEAGHQKEIEAATGAGISDTLAFSHERGQWWAGGNLFINLRSPFPVNVTGVAALRVCPSTYGRTAEWLPSAAIRKIARRRAAVGKCYADASIIFPDVFDALAELHPLATPEVQHLALQFSARETGEASPGALHQRGRG